MSRPKREPRTFTVAQIAQRFELVSFWFGPKWCPAVHRTDHGYGIRIQRSRHVNAGTVRDVYDYFELDADGVITTAPRGFAKEYRPGRVTDIAAVAEQQSHPDPTARRLA